MAMSLDEFLAYVKDAAREVGWVVEGEHHPEDIAANLTPVMQAWAAGYAVGYRLGRADK